MRSDSTRTASSACGLAALVTKDPRTAREKVAGRLRLVFALYHDGVAMKRAAFRRAFPGASPEAIEEKVRLWLVDRLHDQPGV